MSDIGPVAGRGASIRAVVVGLCFATVVLDGYDLIIYGAVVPSLLEYEPWGVTPGQAGAFGSYALVGMMIGALSSGMLTDLWGRRRIMLVCTLWFSVATGLCALAPNPEIFGVLRFLAGLGLGGVLPTAISLTNEYAPAHRKQFYNAAMTTGYAVGGILASLVALVLIPEFGFRSVFVAGALPILVLFPLLYFFLPESASFLVSKGRDEEARRLAGRYGIDLPSPAADEARGEDGAASRPGRLLFAPGWRQPTLLFGAANFCGLLLSYGMSTWLPATMRAAGYPLSSSLSFLLTLNIGAIVGVLVGSLVADRVGPRVTIAISYLVAGLCIVLLSVSPPTLVLYLLVAVAGFGAIGTQILLNGFVASYYPTRARGSALGWSLGVGRLGGICGPLIGGLLLGAAIGFNGNFYAFGLTAVLAGVLVSLVTTRRARGEPEPASAPVRPTTAGGRGA